MAEPVLSIIIPVFQTPEAFLRRCLDRILELKALDFEVILVDDASPDHCPRVLDEYAVRHSRFRVVHRQANGRAGQARNDGLQLARGEYLWFVDADDQIVPEAVSELISQAHEQEADIVMFSSDETDEQGNLLRRQVLPEKRFDLTLPKNRANSFYHLHYALWNKLFRRQMVESLRFHSFPANIGEDTLYNVAALCRCRMLFSTSMSGYRYTKFSGSATHQAGKGLAYLQTIQKSQRAITQELFRTFGREGRRYADCLSLKRFVTGCEWIAENDDEVIRLELRQFWEKYYEQLDFELRHYLTARRVIHFLLKRQDLKKSARHMRRMLFISSSAHHLLHCVGLECVLIPDNS